MGNPNQFKEKYGPYALVTGASSGLGKEFAIQLASKGMNLVLLARRKELLIDLKEDLEKTYSIHAIVCPIDLSEENFLDKRSAASRGGKAVISLMISTAVDNLIPNLVRYSAASLPLLLSMRKIPKASFSSESNSR